MCLYTNIHTCSVCLVHDMKPMILVQSGFFHYVVCAPLALHIIQIHNRYVRDTERKECLVCILYLCIYIHIYIYRDRYRLLNIMILIICAKVVYLFDLHTHTSYIYIHIYTFICIYIYTTRGGKRNGVM